MNKHPVFTLFFVLVIFLSSGCNFPGIKGKTIPPEFVVQTAAAQTVEALSTEIASTKIPLPPLPTQGELPVNPLPTAANPPTQIPPTQALPPTSTLPNPTAIPCDRASFVDDVSVPDGAAYSPNTNFTKTWRLKNNGSCTWSSGYKLVFDSGNAMGGPATLPLPSSVPPGGEVEISVNLKSPAASNTYQGNWKLQNASGASFGIGVNADKSFWVKIIVGSTDPTPASFAVTSVNISASPSSYSGTCPVVITFSASIVTSAAGTVTYFWERNDGAKGATETLVFDSAGSKSVTDTWTLGGSGFVYSGWEKVYIDQPNHQYFSPANFSIACSP